MADTIPTSNGLVLNNIVEDSLPDDTYSFANEPTEFGTDNCATHHICSILGLFINMRTADDIGVRGVNGSSLAAGIGSI